ncbi:hypothetical protein D3C85_866140 [compost metagenome]
MHGGDAEADGQGGREIVTLLDARPAEGVHGHQRRGHHYHQGQGGGGDVVVDGDRRFEGQHGDEVHRPDAAPQAAGAEPAPAPTGFRLLGMGHPFGHVEGTVAGYRSHQESQKHQPAVMGAGQEYLVIRRKFTSETQAQPIHRGIPMQWVQRRGRCLLAQCDQYSQRGRCTLHARTLALSGRLRGTTGNRGTAGRGPRPCRIGLHKCNELSQTTAGERL